MTLPLLPRPLQEAFSASLGDVAQNHNCEAIIWGLKARPALVRAEELRPQDRLESSALR